MSWVNFNFGFVNEWFGSCDGSLEIDMWATLVSSSTILLGTFIIRYTLNTFIGPCTFIGPWYINFKVFCSPFIAKKIIVHAHAHARIYRCCPLTLHLSMHCVTRNTGRRVARGGLVPIPAVGSQNAPHRDPWLVRGLWFGHVVSAVTCMAPH
jgi:hypothetical protein